MTCLMACSECSYPPQTQCVTHNSGTAHTEPKLSGLRCPRGKDKTCNWVYVDLFVLSKYVRDRQFVSKAITHICYSQAESELGIQPHDFFLEQGRIYRNGQYEFDNMNDLKLNHRHRASIDSDTKWMEVEP